MKTNLLRSVAIIMSVGLVSACAQGEEGANAAVASDEMSRGQSSDAAGITTAGQVVTVPVSAAEEEAAGGPAVAVFPAAFRGNWDYNENGCVAGESGTRFRITASEVKGYEDTSKLQAIEIIDDLTVRVVMENESAEGTEVLTQTWRLSPVAGINLRMETGGKTIRALRCDPV